MLLLFGVPWWTLLAAGAAWPAAGLRHRHAGVRGGLRRDARADDAGSWPSASRLGRGWRRRAARRGLGAVRVVGARPAVAARLLIAGVDDPARSRVVAAAVIGRGGGAPGVGLRRSDAGSAGQERRRRHRPTRARAGRSARRDHHRHALRADRSGTVVGRGGGPGQRARRRCRLPRRRHRRRNGRRTGGAGERRWLR